MQQVTSVILQPTSLCNLDCEYCYLPERRLRKYISQEVLERVAEYVSRQDIDRPISIVWHGGEPLATGIGRFKKMLELFDDLWNEGKIVHYIQTNATLISDEWCQLFLEYKIKVGVSIDGPVWANKSRVDWSGNEAFTKIMKGIEHLNVRGIPYTVIAVVGEDSMHRPDELFDFFSRLGCQRWAINIVEQEGVYDTETNIDPALVQGFWKRLFELWLKNPDIGIREFNRVLDFAYAGISGGEYWLAKAKEDWLPTISYDGSVFLLSPELAGIESEMYGDFVAGNILQQTLEEIISDSLNLKYVIDFKEGVNRCESECPYFAFCRGGQAGNKFFENGSMASTQTNYCRNSKMLLFDGVISVLKEVKINE